MNNSVTNPLLEVRFEIPFDQIDATHVEPAASQLIADAQALIDAIAEDAGPRTLENTLLALETTTETLGFAMGVVGHLESVKTTPELRAAYNAVRPALSAFYSAISLNEKLWRQLKRYAETDEARALTGLRARLLQKTLEDFRRSGADLPAVGKKRLAELDVELALATQKFSEHVLDATNAFELLIDDESKLAGLPQSAKDAARESAAKKDKAGWRFTLQGPSYLAVMTYLDDSDIREQVWRAYNTRASAGEFDNTVLLATILKLRAEKAALLGRRNFADLVLEDRMAKGGARAKEFIQQLAERTRSPFLAENEALENFRRSLEGSDSGPMRPWDVGYHAEKLRQREYDFDEEQLRPYFPYERVKQGLFELVQRLYGIEVRQERGVPVWRDDVQYYSLYDSDGSKLGAFYADYFPDEQKRGGAWMDSFLTGAKTEKGWEPHLGLMCGNLNPPVGNKPALLTHRDVETLFHEFGHLLHHLLTRVEIRSLAGTNVAWDFVELPSQIMENWCWEREALDLFAQHYETAALIPDELFQKMKRARTFRAANQQMRQLGLATLDLALHIDYDPDRDGDVMAYARSILAEFAPAPLPEDYAMPAAFTHLFADPVGYGAGYYSYKWSEVLDADAFTRFAAEGIFNPQTGAAFRENILSKGDSEDPERLFAAFMGREPSPEALMARLGLV
ncbi:MAG: M3 family metallopeptidase [Acidobacteria bacterium]|nr:M3 family metallopeptidase [Acidobacteriota bacterium]MDA1233806.1 M3 family metallopeptidase [Acidobacteriota bacterium]